MPISRRFSTGSPRTVQTILENFSFRHQIDTLSKADALGALIEKFTSPSVNLSPDPVLYPDGSVRYPGLDNHAMGTIFEELLFEARELLDEAVSKIVDDISEKVEKRLADFETFVSLFEAGADPGDALSRRFGSGPCK